VTYAVAVLAALAGLALRIPLDPIIAAKVPYITFFLAVAVSARFGGFGPGLVTTWLGALLAAMFVVPPTLSIYFAEQSDYWGLGLFLLIGSFLSHQAGQLMDAASQEAALRILMQQTLTSIGEAVVSADDHNRVCLMNPVAERLTGWSQEEARGRPLSEVVRTVREGTDSLTDLSFTGLTNHTELVTRSGTRVPIDHSGSPISDAHGHVVGSVLVFRDATDRRRAELQLIAAERRSRSILESITDAFVFFDRDWRHVEMNPSAAKAVGLPAEALTGTVLWDRFPGFRGTVLEQKFRQAVEEGTSVHFEHYQDEWDRWFDISAYPSAEGLAVYFREITDRKRAEATLVRVVEDLRHFTFAATHDMREPLRMITVYVEMLQRRLSGQLDAQAGEFIRHVVNGAERISHLIDGLLQFTRLGEDEDLETGPVDMEAALSGAIDNLQLRIAETQAQVEWDPLPPATGNAAHIGQLFQNLVSNALKYRVPGTPPRIHISGVRHPAECVYAVRDNGIGIALEDQERIFVPFKRLHGSEIAGAGIGLATCKRIVERYGGRIWVESSPGSGSTFYFSLPA
jgi:PAS domain S-box-containing protein